VDFPAEKQLGWKQSAVQFVAPSGQRTRIQSAGLAVTGLGAGIALLYFGRAFWITLIVSVVLAFMLEPFVGLLRKLKFPRALASFVVCTLALLFVYTIGALLVAQLSTIAEDLPAYSQRVNELVDGVAAKLESAEQTAYKLLVPRRFQREVSPAEPPPPVPARKRRQAAPPPPQPPQVQEVRIHEDRPPLFAYLAGYVSSVYQTLLMVSFIPFLVYFMLSWREHIHRGLLSIYGAGRETSVASRSLQAIASVARAYVVGNFILGILISFISCIIFWTWQLPYWLLIGFISGFLSLVPYVGLPLAVIPPLAAALITYTNITPYLVIGAEVAGLHLLALNLLYPWIVGARVHLNPLAVTVALMFWGTIWGGIGLVLAIPITAAVKAVLDNDEDLAGFGRLLGD
jgi:predicted PurR-regulated permease PerM